jgi:hypothetical protein
MKPRLIWFCLIQKGAYYFGIIPRWPNLANFLLLERGRIVSGHLEQNCQQFFTASPLEIRACCTGRKIAE